MVIFIIGAIALPLILILLAIAWFIYAVHKHGGGMAIIFPPMYDHHRQR